MKNASPDISGFPAKAVVAALVNAEVICIACVASNTVFSDKNLVIVSATPVYLATILPILFADMLPPASSADSDVVMLSLTPSCRFSHPDTIGLPLASRLPSIVLLSFVSISPKNAPTPALTPPVTKAFNGSCPYTIAVAADLVPPDIAADTVELSPALAIEGSTNLDTVPPTLAPA